MKILIDIKTCDMTMSQVMGYIKTYQYCHPNEEVFTDGDAYAIVSEVRA